MKRAILFLWLSLAFTALYARNTIHRDSTSYICDGGMMLHTGYLTGDITPIGYHASGAPFGIGGLARYHFAKHWRVGFEGYVSTLSQLKNGSFIKYGWGGVLCDFYWDFGRVMPYVGTTVGGGANTDMIMFEAPTDEWTPVGETYYHKKGFALVDPYIGLDVALTHMIHLTFKVDCIVPLGRDLNIPIGPRFYLGILFYH